MKSLSLLFVCAAACAAIHTAQAAAPTHPELAQELLQMRERDQQARNASDANEFRKIGEVDAVNTRRMKEIVDRYGWPTYAMVGEQAARAAWVLVQHADLDKPFQLRMLALMADAVKAGQAAAGDYAYLYDRTHYPQRFGTQGSCVTREEWQPLLIEDAAGVHERRREVGLMPLADYVVLMNKLCANPLMSLHRADDPRVTMPVPK